MVSWCNLLHMAATTTARAAETLCRDIPPPNWGDTVGRLRKQHYKNAATLATEVTTHGVPTTAATISRLEALAEVPTDRARRVLAAVILVLCDIHPELFGIALEELPGDVYLSLFETPDDPSGLEITPRACNGGTLPPRARRATPASVAA